MSDSMINLTRGVPPREVLPTEDIILCTEAALRRDGSVLLQYGRSPGYAPLREWLGTQYSVGPDRIFVGNSSLEVFAFITQTLVRPGDRAFVEAPSYDRAITLLRRAGADVVGIPLRNDGIDMDVLREELARGVPSLMYVIPDFNNPSGVTTSLEKRRQLAEMAKEYGFWLVEDSPYHMLRYLGQDVPRIWSEASERVLLMSSVSKLIAPGVRVGYAVATPEQVAALAGWAVDTYVGPVFLTEAIVHEYCSRGLLQRNIARLKEVYRPRLQATFNALERHLPQASWTRAEGGFFVGVTLPKGIGMASLLGRAEQVGLKFSDGRGFFPNPSDGNRFLRIPFSSVTPEQIDEGIQRLALLLTPGSSSSV